MQGNANRQPEAVERFLDSTLDSVDSAEELAVGLAQRAGMDEDDLMKIGMAIRESMVNAVVHGNRYNAHKKVRFAVDFGSIPDPLAPENLLRTSGRGIFLIRSFMDDFQLRRLESGGTEVTLVKNLVSK
jgi:serine/threonine-protein kinase RsbW